MSIEKNYINGIVIKEKVFENGGKQLKGWVKVDKKFVQGLFNRRQEEKKLWKMIP